MHVPVRNKIISGCIVGGLCLPSPREPPLNAVLEKSARQRTSGDCFRFRVIFRRLLGGRWSSAVRRSRCPLLLLFATRCHHHVAIHISRRLGRRGVANFDGRRSNVCRTFVVHVLVDEWNPVGSHERLAGARVDLDRRVASACLVPRVIQLSVLLFLRRRRPIGRRTAAACTCQIIHRSRSLLTRRAAHILSPLSTQPLSCLTSLSLDSVRVPDLLTFNGGGSPLGRTSVLRRTTSTRLRLTSPSSELFQSVLRILSTTQQKQPREGANERSLTMPQPTHCTRHFRAEWAVLAANLVTETDENKQYYKPPKSLCVLTVRFKRFFGNHV